MEEALLWGIGLICGFQIYLGLMSFLLWINAWKLMGKWALIRASASFLVAPPVVFTVTTFLRG